MYPKTRAGLKQELKDLAAKIKEAKSQFREVVTKLSKKEPVDNVGPLWKLTAAISADRFAYRHKHIVYCLLRGKTMEQIEKPSKDSNKSIHNPRSTRAIEILMKEYQPDEKPEAVCVSSN